MVDHILFFIDIFTSNINILFLICECTLALRINSAPVISTDHVTLISTGHVTLISTKYQAAAGPGGQAQLGDMIDLLCVDMFDLKYRKHIQSALMFFPIYIAFWAHPALGPSCLMIWN